MSTFRIERIDKGIPDEWVLRKNDSGSQIGDDVVAEDVNDLSAGIQATQDLLLKTSTLAPTDILNKNSGLAERLTILESIAGKSGLQDAYINGNFIIVKPSRPLTFGAGGEFTLDDMGNISLRPSTFRFRGDAADYLSFAKDKIHTYLSDLTVGATSSGFSLNFLSGKNILLKDAYLTNGVTLSELGETILQTTSQSLVGAINELKNTTFNTTIQSVYNQSESGRLVTDGERGPLRVENGSGNTLLAALQVIGNLVISSGTLEFEKMKLGTLLSVDGTSGLITSLKLKTTNVLETTGVKNPAGNLALADNRSLINLSEIGQSKVNTNAQSLIGSINELKAIVDELGLVATAFKTQHDESGYHEIITTQAALGQDSIKRIVIKNSSGSETASITGAGDIVAKTLTINGSQFSKLLSDLNTHLSNDGTAHSAVQSHLVGKNPHNTVETLNGLRGEILFQEGEGISLSSSGKTISISNSRKQTIQQVYDEASTGDLLLSAIKGLNLKTSVGNLIASFGTSSIGLYKDILFKGVGIHLIDSEDRILLRSSSALSLSSLSDNISIRSEGTEKTVSVQGVDMTSSGDTSVYDKLPSSVVGAINTLARDSRVTVFNHYQSTIYAGTPICLGRNDEGIVRVTFPILDYHPCNDQVFAIADNKLVSSSDTIYITEEDIAENASGRAKKIGPVSIGTGLMGTNAFDFVSEYHQGVGLYLARHGRAEVRIKDISLLSDGDAIVLDNQGDHKTYMASSSMSDYVNGMFRIDNSANLNIRKDKTLQNLMSALNTEAYTLKDGQAFNVKAYWDGSTAKGKIIINGDISAGDTVTITPTNGITGGSVVLTAITDPSLLTMNKFLIGSTAEETAYNLATSINLTTQSANSDQIITITFSDPSVTEFRQISGFATDLTGHYCVAKALGKMVIVEWYKPGASGNLVNLTTSSVNVQIVPMSGGDGSIKIYLLDRTRVTPTNFSSNTNAMTITSFSGHENGTFPLITRKKMWENFNKAKDVKLKIGDIVSASAGSIKLFADVGGR
jgi:hypothetical protein